MSNPSSPSLERRDQTPGSLYASVCKPSVDSSVAVLTEIAEAFSPRYERHGDHLVTIDVRGLDRLLGSPRTIGEELRRYAAERGVHGHIAIAGTQTAAMLLAISSPGLRVIEKGEELQALDRVPITVLEQCAASGFGLRASATLEAWSLEPVLRALNQWGIRTFGEFAALPPADLAARLGRRGVLWQAMARGEDLRPLMPVRPDERFEATLELEWPIEGQEPLSFVLTRLLEPLSTRLEARDRGAAALHLALRLVTRDLHERCLQLPSPLRDVRTLRTLALLDLESHPPAAAIDQVTITIDPTPARILQHTLFTRPHPTPEQLSTLLARLGALMGQDRIGAPALVDSYRPGAFEMRAFAIDHDHDDHRRTRGTHRTIPIEDSGVAAVKVVTALRRCRQPVPARVAVDRDERPVRVTTDRRGFAGGSVTACVGPWRTSGEWWNRGLTPQRKAVSDPAGRVARGAGPNEGGWNRDEWDVALNDGAVYRIFRDRTTDAWFIEAIVD